MKITKVTLQNFRGIGSLELEFPIDQNIITLVGINGAGKSSILDAITILLSTLWWLKYMGDRFDYIHLGNNVVKNDDIKINQEAASCKIVLSDLDDHYELDVFKAFDSYKHPDQGKLSRRIEEILFVRYSSGRQAELISSESYQMNSTKTNASFDEFFTWFKALEDIENEEKLIRNNQYRNKKLEAVRNSLSSILLEQGFECLRVKRATNDLIVNKDGMDVSVKLLSDGEKGLIALVSHIAKNLATTYPDLENPLEGDGIILIDEIELHMHPTWQRMIIPRLTAAFPNCQFIVTTHSPQVLSHLQPESIYLLKKVGEDITVVKPQYSYGRDSNRILEDLMDETERPAEIQDQLGELFSLIHQGQLSEAQQLVSQLSATIGASEPELNKAEVMIKRREIIGR